MARKRPPSFDFFPDDFVAGTYHLEAEAVGVYVRLLCYQWNNGSIPAEPDQLARIAGVDADAMRTHMRTVMLKFMPSECGGLKNERLEVERAHKLSVIEKSKHAADTRWAKQKAGKNNPDTEKPKTKNHADALRTDMPPTSNILLPTSVDNETPLIPQGGNPPEVKETQEPEQPIKTDPKPDPKDKPPRKPKVTIGEYQIPPRLDTPEIRKALDDFEAMRLDTGRRIKNRANICRGWDKVFRSPEHLLACIEKAISGEYQGISANYVDPKDVAPKKPTGGFLDGIKVYK
jgi:uncharacterized protein YdaU (DUF1376 family)